MYLKEFWPKKQLHVKHIEIWTFATTKNQIPTVELKIK